MARQDIDLITVHGTFAGDPADSGDKWWQKGSPFLTKLQSFIAEPLNIRPFHWSGANAEVDRRRAGVKLAKDIQASENPPIVIGHSHGGSTTAQAMAMLAIRQGEEAKESLRGAVSIGMPLILFQSNRNPFTRFNLYGRILLLIALSIGLVYTIDALAVIFAPDQFRQPFPHNVLGHLGFFFGRPERNIFRNILTYTVSITLLTVAGFGIYNILNMTIYNKMKDIAILKAMGFSARDVTQIFLTQSIIIGLLGSLAGLILGYLLAYGISKVPFDAGDVVNLTSLPVNFSVTYYIIGIVFGLLTTSLAGYLPARKAGKVDPIEILRG